MSELKFNVAQLLRESIGGRRDHTFTLAALPLDDRLQVHDLEGRVRFTRSGSGVVARVQASGRVRLTCVRSLQEFEEPVTVDFTDEFHSVVDVTTGISLPTPLEDDPYYLSETHMADIGKAIREYVLIALPMYPVCPEYRDMPVSYTTETEGLDEDEKPEEPIDDRLAVLKNLLPNNDEQQKS